MKIAQVTAASDIREQSHVVSAYWELTKPRIVLMVLITTGVGFILGCRGDIEFLKLLSLLVWSGFSCAGVGVLNQYLEKEEDSRMQRTASRPLPTKRISPKQALVFGLLLAVSGSLCLWMLIDPLCGLLSCLTCLLYVLVYTPLKKRSWLNTLVGAIPGALPPLGGWVAGSGQLEVGGLVLFLILFFWQHPHFYSIAWMYKDDYARGGFKMLPSEDPSGRRMFYQIFVFLSLLTFASLLPVLFSEEVGTVYFIAALLLSSYFWKAGLSFYKDTNRKNAARLLRASVLYLPALLTVLIVQVKF